MEAELFGYARGAFSGAVQRYDGQLMAAAGGTVFLDEIDDTPLETQVKLLRVLEDRVVSRLGENVWHEVDFRLLAATNRDLRALDRGGPVRRRPLRAAGDRHDSAAAAARAARGSAGARAALHARFAREQKRAASRDIWRRTRSRALLGLPVARQHPRAAERDLRNAGLQARRRLRSCCRICRARPHARRPTPARSRRSIARSSRARSSAGR